MNQNKFHAIVFTGSDIEYALACLEIAKANNVNILMIIGPRAAEIAKLANLTDDKSNFPLFVINSGIYTEYFDELKELCKSQKGIKGLLFGYDSLIPKSVLKIINILNCHPSYLPHNRGSHHSFFGIMDRSPLGASLHWIDEGLDTGPVIAQKKFIDSGFLTAEQVKSKSMQFCLELWAENLSTVNLPNGTAQSKGSHHNRSDIIKASTILENELISGSKLFDLCRATNYKNNGFRVVKNGRTFLVRIEEIEEIE